MLLSGFRRRLMLWLSCWRTWLGGVLLFVALLLAGIAFRLFVPEAETLAQQVSTLLPQGLWGMVVYAVGTALLSCVAVPRQMLSFAGGYLFGALSGTVVATLGVGLGCVIAFSVARTFGQGAVQRRYGERIARFNTALLCAPFSLAVLLRLFPSGNNLLFSILGGVSSIPARPFWGGSLVGYLPQNIVFALLGSGLRVDPLWRMSLSAVLFGLSALLGWWLYRRYRAVFS